MERWSRTVGILFVWQVTASTAFYSVFAGTQFFRQTFDVSYTLIGFIVTALMIGYTVGLFPAGTAVDSFGDKRILLGGLLGVSVAAVGMSVAWSYPVLLVAAFLLGLLYATAMPGTNKAITTTVPTDHQSLAMGVKQVGVTGGSAASALLVTWFGTSQFGWQGGFLVAGIAAVLTTGGFAYIYYGTGGTGSLELPDIRGLLAHPEYRTLVAAGGFLGAALFTTTGYTTLYVSEYVATTPAFAGLVLAIVQISGSTGRVIFGGLADRLNGTQTQANARILFIQGVFATVLFLLTPLMTNRLQAILGFALLGFFVLGFTGIYYACLGGIVTNKEIGSATAGGQMALNAGALLAPPIFGYLISEFGYRTGWELLAGCTLVGAVLLYPLID